MHGILTIAHLTFEEARRRKVLLAAFLFGSAFIALFATGFYFINRDLVSANKGSVTEQRMILNFFVMAGLYAINFLMVMTAVLTPVDTLAGEIESGAIQTLVTKPMGRTEILLGKWLGFWIILTMYLALMAGGVLLVARVISGFTPPGVAMGLPLMWLEGTLLMTLTIAGGTRLSTLANGIMVFGLYGIAFIGGWVEQIGTIAGNATAQNVGVIASLLVPSESLWQLAAYHMQPPLMRQLRLSPFSPASVPSTLMIVWAFAYTLATLAVGIWQFRKRNL